MAGEDSVNPYRNKLLPATVLLALALGPAGCGDAPVPVLQLDDLKAGERLYVERFVTLERARAVAFGDRARGEALLDSLAAAWGDSSLVRARAALPGDPARATALHALLLRILEAEADSLVAAGDASRLAAPLPDPSPAAP